MKRFVQEGWDVVIEDGVVGVSNKPTCDAAKDTDGMLHPEPERVIVPDSLIQRIAVELRRIDGA